MGVEFVLRVYECDVDSRDIKPDFQQLRNLNVLPGDFLEGAWDIDILSQEGLDKTKEIVGEIAKGIALKVRMDVFLLRLLMERFQQRK